MLMFINVHYLPICIFRVLASFGWLALILMITIAEHHYSLKMPSGTNFLGIQLICLSRNEKAISLKSSNAANVLSSLVDRARVRGSRSIRIPGWAGPGFFSSCPSLFDKFSR